MTVPLNNSLEAQLEAERVRRSKLAFAVVRIEAIIRDESIGDDNDERITRIAAVLDSLEVKTS